MLKTIFWYLAITVIPLSGLSISSLSDYCTAFQRSGCVMVVVAMILFGIHHQPWKGVEPGMWVENGLTLGTMAQKVRIERAQQYVPLEFYSGSVGTLIWGFGDLYIGSRLYYFLQNIFFTFM